MVSNRTQLIIIIISQVSSLTIRSIIRHIHIYEEGNLTIFLLISATTSSHFCQHRTNLSILTKPFASGTNEAFMPSGSVIGDKWRVTAMATKVEKYDHCLAIDCLWRTSRPLSWH